VVHGILCEEDLVAGKLAPNGPNPLDRDAGAVGDYNIMTGIGDVLVVNEVAPVRKEVMGGARVNT
jgi:hypothetical protein